MVDKARFYNLLQFYNNKEYFRLVFSGMNSDDKKIYKMYVYSLPFMEDNIKDLIWDYLNGYEESKFDLAKEYRKAKNKLEKRRATEV